MDALARSRIVDTVREPEFDDVARLAASVTDSPMAMISFVDRDRLWLKATHGLSLQELPRAHSFCAVAIDQERPFSVYDAALDERFSRHVLVASSTPVRSYTGAPLKDPQGPFSALGTLAVLDVVPRKLSQAQLEALEALARQVISLLELRRLRDTRLLKSEALLASATRISGIGCWQWNMTSGEITWSNEMYDIFGLPRSTIPSLEAFQSCVHPDDRAIVAARTALTLQGSMTTFPDYRVERPNGEVRTVQATAELERDSHGKPALLTGALLDVTEQRLAEEARKRLAMQVMQSQKLESLGVLSAGVAHDFNNLLVGILGNAELALADPELSHNTRDLMGRVTEAAVQAAGLTRQLLAYTGRGRRETAALDLSAQVLSAVELLRSSLSSSAVLSSSLPKQLPAIQADGEGLQQLVMSLIMNAVESYPSGSGEVRVRTYVTALEGEARHDMVLPAQLLPGRYVVLEVSDQGCGMSQDMLERVFEPFYSTKFTGRGLGLAAVLGISRSHRAVLTVDSRPGQGSCFRVHFPALDRSARDTTDLPQREPAAGHVLAGRTVLVVDDEARVRLLERRVLETYGVSVLEAGTGDEAIDLLAQSDAPVDAVLLDLVMPGLDSASTLRALRRLRPQVPVIIQSGYSEEEVTTRLLEIDEQLAFLPKPFSPKTLVEQVSQLLAARPEAASRTGR
ncbi:MAG: Multi-sensor hybrid histidine kinase [Myxococcaceae bacterium]|nr:Multi-sensor hybrid histidine kinase [Myxococcaceae bacterium]